MSLYPELRRIVRRHATRARWIIVPSHGVGNTLGERLALEGLAWANLRFVTPLDLAVRMAGPFLVEQGIDPSDEEIGPALVMRLLLELPIAGGYFRPLADQPSMADALWRTIAGLRLAGVTSERLKATRLTSLAKQQELAALLRAYEAYLADRRVADAALVYRAAAAHHDFCPLDTSDLVVEWPDALWAPLVRQFLDSLPGDRVAVPTIDVPRLAKPRRLSQHRSSAVEAAASSQLLAIQRLRHLMTPESAPQVPVSRDDETLQLFHAGGSEAEIEEILRRMLACRAPLDEVEIACASDLHVQIAWEKALRLKWAVTSHAGVAAALTRPVGALLGWCEWIEGGLVASRLRRLLQSGDVAPGGLSAAGGNGDGVSAGQAARLLWRAGAAWGRATYAPAFARLRATYRSRLPEDDVERARQATRLKRLERVEAWVEATLAGVPMEDAGGCVDMKAVAASARSFLAANARRPGALDAAAAVTLEDRLAELDALGSFQMPMSAALRLVRERVTSAKVGAERPRPGHLHLSSLATAGLSGRRVLFVAGLEEGRVFPGAGEDPVLLDIERQAVDSALAVSDDRLREAVYATVMRLASFGVEAGRRICLSYSCRDTREFRDTFPSWIVLQAFRLLRGDASLDYHDLSAWLGEPVSAVPAHAAAATTESGWWLARARQSQWRTEASVLAAYPALARGREAMACRASQDLTAWDGYVAEAGPALDLLARERPVSVSTLEDAAACPFRFFLKQGLGLDPPEEVERDTDTWLNPLARGRELHDLFALTMRELRAERRRPALERDLPRLLRHAEERLAVLRRELPPPSDDVFAAERDDMFYDLELFLRGECEREAEPVAFEVGFGLADDPDHEEPLALSEPIAIPVGRNRHLRLHGRIDRIDRLPDGSYETIDYKTGFFRRTDWDGTFAGGRRLQHAVYGVAARSMLASLERQPTIVRGTYLFPSARGAAGRVEIPTPAPAAVAGVLNDLAGVVRAGTFLQTTEASACRFCTLKAACGAEPWVRAASKVGNAPLDALRRLRTHE